MSSGLIVSSNNIASFFDCFPCLLFTEGCPVEAFVLVGSIICMYVCRTRV